MPEMSTSQRDLALGVILQDRYFVPLLHVTYVRDQLGLVLARGHEGARET